MEPPEGCVVCGVGIFAAGADDGAGLQRAALPAVCAGQRVAGLLGFHRQQQCAAARLSGAGTLCCSRFGWGWDRFVAEANTGKGLKMHDWMRGYLTYVLPVIVLFIFAFGIYDKFFA